MSLIENSRPAHSPKKLGLLNAISINMSAMVGTGPFITVPAILATMGGPQSLICWALGAVIAIADGLVFAELGTSFPSSGGTYNYLRACFGPERWGRLMAWLFVWQFLFSGTLEIATGTVGMAAYSTFLFRDLVLHPWVIRFLAAAFSVLSMLLLYRKIRDIARILFVLWIAMLVTSAWVIFEGILHLQFRLLVDIPAGAFHPNAAFLLGMGNGTMLVMYNFLGYYNICHLAGEARRPERVIPYSIIGSIILVLLLDAGISVAFTGVLPWREMIQPGTLTYNAVGSVFMDRVVGPWASGATTILILVTAFASTYSMMLGYSRIPYAAALDGSFLLYFAKTHPTKEFPHRALLLVGVLSTIASFFNLVEIITALLLARILIMFVAQIIGLLLLRRTRPDVPRPFRMWLYPLPALFAMVFWLSIFSSQAFEPEGWLYMVAVLAVFATGTLLYLVVAKRQHHWPFLLPKRELPEPEQACP
jgi:basic amino acid/polyamine antiporter, APA family